LRRCVYHKRSGANVLARAVAVNATGLRDWYVIIGDKFASQSKFLSPMITLLCDFSAAIKVLYPSASDACGG
jgi:hypothetical protein